MSTHFLDPKTDVAFKRVFGKEGNEDILLHFLNDILEFPDEKKIESLKLLPTQQLPTREKGKTTFLDVLCKDKQGKRYIVEMQVAYFPFFKERIVLYGANSFGSQFKSGEPYSKLKDVYTISVLNFPLLDSPDFISHHHFANTKTHENQLKSLYFTIIELPKFNKELYECTSMVDKWCYFFKMAEKSEVKDIDSLSCGDKSIKMAYEELEEMKWNKADLMRYEEAHFRDDKYKRSIEEAVKEAVEETKKQQKLEMELKMEESKKQQKLEIEENKKQQKLEIAKTLLDSGLKLNFASKSTGLTPQEIKDYLEKANGSTKD